ncbi:MAG: glycosyltransferase [bacterium]|nr:glycosyltransferase [bacterium]
MQNSRSQGQSPQSDIPLVSVVIPTWNAAAYLPETLETIFNQTWPQIQIVVVDDGSTDSTNNVLGQYQGRIKTINLENSGGPSRPRNKGIEHSDGEFIAIFDSDDLMEPEKLALAMEVFRLEPNVGLVCTNFRSIDPNGEVLNPDYLAEYHQFRTDLQPANIPDTQLISGSAAFSHLLRGNFIGTSSVVCRREVFEAAGPFDEEMKNADDIDMWLRIAQNNCTMAFIDQQLHSYRITPGGVTARGAGRIPAMIKGLENQIDFCCNEADKNFIHQKIRHLHLDRAWELRQSGNKKDSLESYRAGLAMGFGLRPFIGFMKTLLLPTSKGSE